MLPPPTIHAEIFRRGTSRKYGEQASEALLNALAEVNRLWIKYHPNAPKIYQSGVRYRRERGQENWQAIPVAYRNRAGDCDDAAAWRAGELQAQGERAKVIIYRTGAKAYHAVVKRGDGSIEDPSKILVQLERRGA